MRLDAKPRAGALLILAFVSLWIVLATGLAAPPIRAQAVATPTSAAGQSSRTNEASPGFVTYATIAEGGKYAGRPILFNVSPDGKNRKLLVCKGEDYVDYQALAWSPDGKWLAFTWYNRGNYDIYLMDAAGENLRRLTSDPAKEDMPAWSPDGTLIAFASDRGDFRDVYVVNFDGQNERRLTDNTADNNHPSWSPDGKRIAFSSNLSGSWLVYLMDADGGNTHPLAENEVGDQEMPAWSPDGKHIAFMAGSLHDVYVMDSDGANVRRITGNDAFHGSPVWSPDGRFLAFSRFGSIPGDKSGHSFAIMIADVEGRDIRVLLTNQMPVEQYSWSP